MFTLLKLPPPPPKVQIPVKVRMLEKHSIDITICPKCKSGTMELIATYYRGVLCKTYEHVTQNIAIHHENEQASP